MSLNSDIIISKIFGNYCNTNLLNSNLNLSNSNSNSQKFEELPIFRLIFYFNNYDQDEFNITTPGYIENIISNISSRCPQKLQEIVITYQDKILETYSNQIDNDSIREILLSLLTIKADLQNEKENFNYNKNLNERYFTACLYIIDKFISFDLGNFYNDSKKIADEYFLKLDSLTNQNDKKFHIEVLEGLYSYKFKIKNLFILIFKFLKFVDITYPNKLDDILLKIFQFQNLKAIESILFAKSFDPTKNETIYASDIFIIEEFLFFFSYFLKISFNKRNSNKDYLLNNFFIDDYEKIYSQSNGTINTYASDVNEKIQEMQNNEGKDKEVSQAAIEDKVLSAGENATGKIDNLYSCSFNLEEKLNDSTKFFLLEFYLSNFPKFYSLVNKIKVFYTDIKNCENPNNKHLMNEHLFNSLFFKNAVSTSYIYFLDFLIVLFDQNRKEFSLKKLLKEKTFPQDLFNNLINDVINYRANPFLQIKILRIFELLSQKENLQNKDLLKSFLDLKFLTKYMIIKIAKQVNFKEYIDLEK